MWSLSPKRYHGAVACHGDGECWKTYLSRPEGDAIRGYALNIMGITKGMNNEEALCAATAYREWCCRFDPANIMTADENLALVYKDLGCHDEAIPVLQRVRAEKLGRLRGSENEDSVMTLLNLSASLSCAGRHAEAIALLGKERPAACRALGEDHHLCLSLAGLLGSAHLQHSCAVGRPDWGICLPPAPFFVM